MLRCSTDWNSAVVVVEASVRWTAAETRWRRGVNWRKQGSVELNCEKVATATLQNN